MFKNLSLKTGKGLALVRYNPANPTRSWVLGVGSRNFKDRVRREADETLYEIDYRTAW